MAHLRPVGDDETLPKRREMTVQEAAAEGDRLDLLYAMRRTVAATIDEDCPARDLAALTRRLLEITKEIETLEAAERKAREGTTARDRPLDASAV